MEENKITSRELIKNYLPEPKEFDKLSKFKKKLDVLQKVKKIIYKEQYNAGN